MNGMGNGIRKGKTSPGLDASAIAASSPFRDASMRTCPKMTLQVVRGLPSGMHVVWTL
jgi:hypothetical protein